MLHRHQTWKRKKTYYFNKTFQPLKINGLEFASSLQLMPWAVFDICHQPKENVLEIGAHLLGFSGVGEERKKNLGLTNS